MVTFPLSLLFTVKVVQEYERAVIFRMGRLLSGGASGPGVFFIIPCMDIYVKIDMRTSTYEIPPQEVIDIIKCWPICYRLKCYNFITIVKRSEVVFFYFLTLFAQILTKDSVTVFVNAIMYYKVRDATLAVSRVDDYSGSSRLLSATTLRNVLGTKVA